MRMRAAIFADGNPSPPALRQLLRRGRFTIVLDGAAEAVRKQGWLPNLVAGDFDSASRATLRYFEKKGVELLHTPDQSHTDLEKALAWCVLRDAASVWIAQALGSRLDHSFTALSLLKRYASPGRELVLFGEGETVRYVRDGTVRLSGRKGRGLAVLPFPRCLVRSKGLRYEMDGTALALGRRESVSNAASAKVVRLEIEGEALVVESLR
jgi:thiamine pyrophosphokinase